MVIGKFLSLVKNFKTGLGSWNFLSPPFINKVLSRLSTRGLHLILILKVIIPTVLPTRHPKGLLSSYALSLSVLA